MTDNNNFGLKILIQDFPTKNHLKSFQAFMLP